MRKAILSLLLGVFLASCAAVPQSPLPKFGHDPEAHYLALLGALMDQCPLSHPVIISRTSTTQDGVWGDTWWDVKAQVYRMRIHNTQSQRETRGTLMHEWAHAMVWKATQRPEDKLHGPMFGVAWARCYRALLSTYPGADELKAEGCGTGL